MTVSHSQPIGDEPSPQELRAWADEAQACIDSGEVVISDHRKAKATIDALRSHAALKARVLELEANEAAYEAILGPRTYNEVAEHIRGLEEALKETALTAALLQQNSVSCAELHHGFDIRLNGLPGWLTNTKESIDRAFAAISHAGPVARDKADK